MNQSVDRPRHDGDMDPMEPPQGEEFGRHMYQHEQKGEDTSNAHGKIHLVVLGNGILGAYADDKDELGSGATTAEQEAHDHAQRVSGVVASVPVTHRFE